MPQMVNGCGTWYYGKKNLQQYQGRCRACGRVTTLSSYDTRLYVVVVAIPIIPLGKKRIIEKCSACTRHQVMPLDDYRRAENRLNETMAAYRAQPANRDLAKEALQACVSFRNLPAFTSIAPELEKNLASDAEALCWLAAVWDLFARPVDSERVWRASLAVKDEDETREQLASALLRQGKPAEAEPYLRHVVEKSIPDRVGSLYHLAQAYQAVGQHEKAIEIFDQCEAINPGMATDETFTRLKDASTQRLGTNQPLAMGEVAKKAKSQKTRQRFVRIAPIAAGLAVLAYATLALIQGRRREIFIVNGLDRPYSVRVEGKPYNLQPYSTTRVRTGEGEIEYEIADAPAPVRSGKVTVRTAFFSRPFVKHAFVLNPDGTAIIHHSTIYYSKDGSREPDVSYAGGQTLIHFDDVDHPFEKPPDEVEISSGSHEASRVVLRVLDPAFAGVPTPMILDVMEKHLGEKSVAQITQRLFIFESDSPEIARLLWQYNKPEQIIDLLRPLLSERPLRLQWHRSYQQAMALTGHDDEVQQEYEAMLAKEPASKDMMYLASRRMKDIDKSLGLLRQASEGEGACAYAVFALGSYLLENGQFDEAVQTTARAVTMAPRQIEFRAYYLQSLLADAQYEKALELLRPEESKPWPDCMFAYSGEAEIYCLMNQRHNADLLTVGLGTKMLKFGPGATAAIREQHEALIAYCAGETDRFVQLMEASKNPQNRFEAALTRGDLGAAEKAIADRPDVAESVENRLLMFLAAKLSSNPEAAQRHLSAAADALAKGAFEDRAIAAALRGSPTMPPKDLVRLWQTIDRKVIVLAAMGLVDPANRDMYFSLARKLNFEPTYPHLLIEKVLKTEG